MKITISTLKAFVLLSLVCSGVCYLSSSVRSGQYFYHTRALTQPVFLFPAYSFEMLLMLGQLLFVTERLVLFPLPFLVPFEALFSTKGLRLAFLPPNPKGTTIRTNTRDREA